MRRLKLAIGAMLLLAIPVTLAAAQAPVPTVAVTASGSSITLTPSGQLAAGPTRFTFAGKGEFVLATLRAGVTVDQARQAVSRSGDAALSLVFLEASVPEPGREVTVDLRPNTTYVAVSLAGRSSSLTTFATGAKFGCLFSMV